MNIPLKFDSIHTCAEGLKVIRITDLYTYSLPEVGGGGLQDEFLCNVDGPTSQQYRNENRRNLIRYICLSLANLLSIFLNYFYDGLILIMEEKSI
jgi:hypothetical protein